MTSLFPMVLFSRHSDEWATPRRLVRELEQEFGPFTLDPCATPENATAPRFYTLADDGLAQSWAGERVFMNPPYSAVAAWMQKAYLESQAGALVICLVPARTCTGWFHDIAQRHGEVRFLRGRIRFGDGRGSAPFPSIVVVFRPPVG